jgi:hypothetical protein
LLVGVGGATRIELAFVLACTTAPFRGDEGPAARSSGRRGAVCGAALYELVAGRGAPSRRAVRCMLYVCIGWWLLVNNLPRPAIRVSGIDYQEGDLKNILEFPLAYYSRRRRKNLQWRMAHGACRTLALGRSSTVEGLEHRYHGKLLRPCRFSRGATCSVIHVLF